MRYRYSKDDKCRLVKKAVVYTLEEHRININDVDTQAVYIIERLRANGYETYIVGGAVRDLLLKKKPKDFDIVTAANPAKIKKIFRNARIIGNRFRLVHVYFGPRVFEVSTFRSIKDGPTGNDYGTIEDDVLRRDFTINALFYDPLKQLVVDFVNAMKDIKAKKIRPIIKLSQIFTDDPVRMIRAVKYGAATGFTLPYFLRQRIIKQSSLLSSVSASRLTEEIFKIINSPYAAAIVKALDELGLYSILQPKAAELFRKRQGFKTQYLNTLSSFNWLEREAKPGEALSGLIRDWLEDIVDWQGSSIQPRPSLPERYKYAFAAARKFVLPMNPPRVELSHAIKLLFAEHGVVIKRTRFSERPQKKK